MAKTIIGAILAGVLAVGMAQAHDHWAWIMNYENAKGENCCSPSDAVPISHAAAGAAAIGTVVMAPFPGGPEPVIVNAIYATEDTKGRPWITGSGCLFRWSGG